MSDLVSQTKTCKDCVAVKPINCFDKVKKTKAGFVYRGTCKECRNEKVRLDRITNPEKYRQRERNKKANNPEKYQRLRQDWLLASKEKRLTYQREYRKKKHVETLNWAMAHRQNLNDSYIRDLLVGKSNILSAKDIPQNLVEIKRAELRIKRQLKEMTA